MKKKEEEEKENDEESFSFDEDEDDGENRKPVDLEKDEKMKEDNVNPSQDIQSRASLLQEKSNNLEKNSSYPNTDDQNPEAVNQPDNKERDNGGDDPSKENNPPKQSDRDNPKNKSEDSRNEEAFGPKSFSILSFDAEDEPHPLKSSGNNIQPVQNIDSVDPLRNSEPLIDQNPDNDIQSQPSSPQNRSEKLKNPDTKSDKIPENHAQNQDHQDFHPKKESNDPLKNQEMNEKPGQEEEEGDNNLKSKKSLPSNNEDEPPMKNDSPPPNNLKDNIPSKSLPNTESDINPLSLTSLDNPENKSISPPNQQDGPVNDTPMPTPKPEDIDRDINPDKAPNNTSKTKIGEDNFQNKVPKPFESNPNPINDFKNPENLANDSPLKDSLPQPSNVTPNKLKKRYKRKQRRDHLLNKNPEIKKGIGSNQKKLLDNLHLNDDIDYAFLNLNENKK